MRPRRPNPSQVSTSSPGSDTGDRLQVIGAEDNAALLELLDGQYLSGIYLLLKRAQALRTPNTSPSSPNPIASHSTMASCTP